MRAVLARGRPHPGGDWAARAMRPIIDPRDGDIEDDASSTKQRSLFSLAGSLLAEISLPKLAVAWVLLIGLPGIALGLAPVIVSMWFHATTSRVSYILTGISPIVIIAILVGFAWFGGRPLLRLAEASFWALNALGVQPFYIVGREAFRQMVEQWLPQGVSAAGRASVRAASAAMSGILISAISFGIVALAWPHTRWAVSFAELPPLRLLIEMALANAVVIVSAYFGVAALVWGLADATMAQARDLRSFDAPPRGGRTWRVAHISDLHTVGERYGFRIECGRSGPRGNERLRQVLARLDEIHAAEPLDLILLSGDLTDAGVSAEWAELFDALALYPKLAPLMLGLPGNHDVNVVDRSNPARMDLPTSPTKRLRQLRSVSALTALQGSRALVVDSEAGRIGGTLGQAIEPHRDEIERFADKGSFRLSWRLANLWATVFPMVLPPDTEDGLGIIILNSNADTHFSFTNALGMVSYEQARGLDIAVAQYPRASWIIALHHHVVEYPKPAKALSVRIGTALINGSWFVRRLQGLAENAVVMHGHRHIDWIGECGGLLIVSAPSPVMEATDDEDTYFYIHNLAVGPDGKLKLLEPERVAVRGQRARDDSAVVQADPEQADLE
jgi:predicted MPP superfamily phosphohydrolase